MLVLTREVDQSIIIGGKIRVMVVEVRNGKVRLGFDAPDDVEVWREEIYKEIQKAQDAKKG